jgi:hypothetical protein
MYDKIKPFLMTLVIAMIAIAITTRVAAVRKVVTGA